MLAGIVLVKRTESNMQVMAVNKIIVGPFLKPSVKAIFKVAQATLAALLPSGFAISNASGSCCNAITIPIPNVNPSSTAQGTAAKFL